MPPRRFVSLAATLLAALSGAGACDNAPAEPCAAPAGDYAGKYVRVTPGCPDETGFLSGGGVPPLEYEGCLRSYDWSHDRCSLDISYWCLGARQTVHMHFAHDGWSASGTHVALLSGVQCEYKFTIMKLQPH